MPKKLTIEDMRKIADKRGGKCLSTAYINNYTKMDWMCSEGHTWKAPSKKIKNDETWCPTCAGNVPLTIEDMRKIAEERGGKCLSTEYINSKTKLEWMCAEGHTWEAVPDSIKNAGSWCSKCFAENLALTIEEMQEIAAERGGKCLSTEYVDSGRNLEWVCSEGHTWMATPSSIKHSGSWCSVCAGSETLTIEEMQQIAIDRGGKCLSTKYGGANTKLEWMCAEGHTWEATPHNIKNGRRWCGACNIFYSEELCRTTFEQLFGREFPKVRPDWLISSAGNKMELDGYCKDLGIAFEYNGEQHYRRNFLSRTDEDLAEIQGRDELKSKQCKENGIHLITISFQDDLIDLPKLVERRASVLGLETHDIDFEKVIDFNKVYQHKSHIEEMQTIAEKRGGKCVSEKYINARTNLKWMCSEGHTWETTPDKIKNEGTWCAICANRVPLTIEEMRKIAEERGGKCLSAEYVNGITKLEWMCAEGHTWEATPFSIKNDKSWCGTCYKLRTILKIEDMHKIAADRGGKCLSSEYNNSYTKLEWMCAEGHTWEATPNSVKNVGTWCRLCSRENRKNTSNK